jgi:phage gp36-like protein
MTYATRSDMTLRYGEAEIASLEDADNVGAGDEAVTARALEDASEEVDSYVAVRYQTPLPSVPAPLARAACDIARFRLYKDRPTEEVKYRYERSVKWLEHLAAGKVLLTFLPLLTPEQTLQNTPVTPVATHYDGGVFSDAALSKMVSLERSYGGGQWS